MHSHDRIKCKFKTLHSTMLDSGHFTWVYFYIWLIKNKVSRSLVLNGTNPILNSSKMNLSGMLEFPVLLPGNRGIGTILVIGYLIYELYLEILKIT